MNRYVLDTSFLLSLLVSEDPHHKRAISLAEQLPSNRYRVMVPYIVIAELMISEHAEIVIPFVKHISKNFVQNNKSDLEYIGSLDKSLRRQLKANDCLILTIAARQKAQVVTFDRTLQKAAKVLI